MEKAHEALALSHYPKLLFAGDPGALIPPAVAEDYARRLHDCRLVKLGSGLHYLQEDHPQIIGETVAKFIAEIEGKLSTAQIIDPASLDAGGRVVFGATVDLEDEDSGNAVTYQITGDDEADIKLGRISVGSPIARALIGKEAGDVAEVQAPGGVRRYEIIEVRYE